LEIYLVGGAVRDELLNLPVKEKDWVVVGSTPEEMKAQGFLQVGKDFPVFLHPVTHEEYALARTERKTGRGYTQFTCNASPDVTLEEDLKRRDLTINAIAKTQDGTFIDPYGGQEDLKNKLLRHVSLAFVEDPVRVLRIARFAARFAHLGFTIADDTMQLLCEMVQAGEVDALVPERVWQELHSALSEKNPEVFFQVLRNCGALKILFPELDQLFGVPNPIKWHPEVDTGIHILMVLEAACRLSSDPKVRFAALLHDVGKGLTPREEWPSHPGHEERGVILIKALCERYRIPKNYTDLALLVGRYHGLCHKALELKPTTLVKLLKALDAFRKPQRFKQFLLACKADFQGRPGYEHQHYPQTDFLLQVWEIVNDVPVKPLIEKGLTASKLGEALYRAQVAAVKTFLNREI
jgi:tRNA nucleotidyltransferase (CCA-adding enzyme)